MAKASTLDLELGGGEVSEVPHLEHSFIWCWNLDASDDKSETPWKFLNVVLEKDRKDKLDRSCDKWRSIT